MKWIKVSEQLPPVNPDTGESDYVFVSRGGRFFPEIAQYSDGTWSNEGWHMQELGEQHPLYEGRGKKRHLCYTHWAVIEFPNEKEAQP